jgi:Ca2+-binding EF-hand superfamily protein
MRKALVNMAFDILDTDGSGQMDPADLVGVYDTAKHPDVLSKKKTSTEALREFLDCFDVGGELDGMVTRDEFENYYANVSASIDDDQYFELMIRNAWHISGGEGQAANSANRRVLVIKSDGSQYVEEIKNDLGLKRGDTAGMMARLNAQGVEGSDVSQYGGMDTRSPPATIRSDATSIVSRLRIQAMANRTNRAPATSLPPPPIAPVTLMEIACAGPQGGDYGLPPSQAVQPAFTASKKMFVGSRVFSAGDRLIDPQKLPHAGLGLMMGKLKAALKMRGAAGYVSLQRMFQSMDEDGDRSLSIVELKNALKKLSLPAVEGDVRQIFDYFDRDSSGTIDFNEFMNGMRDALSPKRLALVDMAFTELDSEGCGGVPFEAIASRYNVAMHPEVAAGRMTPKVAIADFLETFDGGVEVDGIVTRDEFITYYSNIGASIDSDEYFDLLLRGVWSLHGAARNITRGTEQSNTRGKGSVRHATVQPERKVSQVVATAPSYARPVSSAAVRSTVRDSSYSLGLSQQQQMQLQVAGQNKSVMHGQSMSPRAATSFPPPNDTASKAAPYFSYAYGSEKPLSIGAANAARVLGTRDNPAGKIPDNGLLHLIGRIKRDLVARGPIGFASLQRVFQRADINGDGTLSLAEFKSAIQCMQLNVKDSELRMLFQYFDSDDSKTINFEEFVKGLRDELGPTRLKVVLKAFKKLDVERSGTVDIGQLAREYNPSQHPDVLLGKMTAKQAMGVFLDTFDAGGEVGGRVTEKEFLNYYTNIGAIIDLDEDFDLLVRGVWGLESGEKKTPIIITYDTRSCSNSPPSSLRKGGCFFSRYF